MRSITELTAPQPRASSRMLGRLTRLICFDRHNRFDHHDFRVMAAGTSTVWAFYVQVAVPMWLPDAGPLPGVISHMPASGQSPGCRTHTYDRRSSFRKSSHLGETTAIHAKPLFSSIDAQFCTRRLVAPLGRGVHLASIAVTLQRSYSCRKIFRRVLWTRISPLYSTKPSFLKRFIKKLTRDRVVPIISASIS
jgi:hypothetical protein